MTRQDLRTLADTRVDDAKVLLAGGRWAAAYYLLGYAVECALKACVAQKFKHEEVPEKTLVLDFYTHRIERLVVIAGLQEELNDRLRDMAFKANWSTVRDWNEASRYHLSMPQSEAEAMLSAVIHPTAGVLPWLRSRW